jgi:hypothetical protein
MRTPRPAPILVAALVGSFAVVQAMSCKSSSEKLPTVTSQPGPTNTATNSTGGGGGAGGGSGGTSAGGSTHQGGSGTGGTTTTSAGGAGGTGGNGFASCSDGIKNQGESDTDCGGPCNPCDDGKACNDKVDCKDKVCGKNNVCSNPPCICQTPTCSDAQMNGAETDVDCGGTCPAKCAIGQKCVGGGDCLSGSCTGNVCSCPAGMVTAGQVGGAGSYCIDATEVTRGDYVKFIAANPPQKEPFCAWNKVYVPSLTWPPDAMQYQLPVVYVDWCDASSYCSWQGKHLCGKIGGGTVDFADKSDETKDQWYNACTAQGANPYPYGINYDGTKCYGKDANDFDGGATSPIAMKDKDGNILSKCQGGQVGLYDMSGNVAEWEDSCDGQTGDSDKCLVRGGSYLSDEAALRCDSPDPRARNTQAPDIGFRCCLF